MTGKTEKMIYKANFWISVSMFFATLGGCNYQVKTEAAGLTVDRDATPETKALYQNMKRLSGRHILFGHQDALAYGVGRNHPENGFCDVKDVCGSYPAVYGWDIGHILDDHNVDSVSFKKMKRLIREGYTRGGIITVSWHEKNPGGGNVNDLTPVVKRLLPGAELHDAFKQQLKAVGDFFKDLKDENGKPIPVIFRPYHEHNGDWFWWGTKGCTEQEYISLYRFTVEYLRDSLRIHQLLYAISPDRSRMNPASFEKDILYAYPGDEYIDILGFDNYWDLGASANYDKTMTRTRQDSLFLAGLRSLVKTAELKNKIPALTETGSNTLPETNWFTDRILKPLKADTTAGRIAYLLVWRNARTDHFFAPYPGHPACQDFINFKNDELILFEDEMPDMYTVAF